MSYGMQYSSANDLATLQAFLNTEEQTYGPIDGIEVDTQTIGQTTRVFYDLSIGLNATNSSLRTDVTIPAGQVAYTRGQALIGGIAQDVLVCVPWNRDTLALRCLSYFQSFGWTRNQAIGIISSIRFEGDFNPNAVGDGGSSYGLCQWLGPDRQGSFSNIGRGSLIGSTFRDQMEFIIWELGHTEHVASAALRSTTTAIDAADKVCRMYERPAHPDIDSPLRQKYAAALSGENALA